MGHFEESLCRLMINKLLMIMDAKNITLLNPRWVQFSGKRYTTLVHTVSQNTLFSDFVVCEWTPYHGELSKITPF